MRKTLPAFTLIELLVVVAIFAIITGVLLANNSKFNSSALLGSLAYDISLSIREAQVYGLSVQTFGTQFSATGYNVQVGYGIHFDAATPTSYFLFADSNANKYYDSSDTVLQTYTVGTNHFIKSFCGTPSPSQGGGPQCTILTSPTINHLDIVFFRPDPDAIITSDQESNPAQPYSSAQITIASPSGETRTVTVQSTGQISVH